ncbi:hypothetical protein bpr_IV086 (plasmid) [Butyrivibrio proteoclasticus B316]|uniref:Uncharacterized protein n=1 Tax=Butyrivibrio proteoclasticus (strain ATCC 51982 / DSM 14932 / B316) TaxID=515622 RepID=E0S4W9_BUTPB|nr:hypothetical protein [Butyrivibrio proteoclasticus]ADL36451.1 hypothetical protein bpr_IV086 [Butyrivibrio proteoclasticus B316]
MGKDRYISKEEYKEYEKYKNAKKQGRLLNPEGLLFLAESADYDPIRLGQIMLSSVERFKAADPYLKSLSEDKLIFKPLPVKDEEEESFLPFIEYTK